MKTAASDSRSDRAGSSFALSPGSATNILWFVVFEAAYYIAYRYGMSFSQTLPSPFWFPDSILLCALLKTRPRSWWLFILGALPIRLLSSVSRDLPLWFLLGTSLVDFAKAWLAAALLRRAMSNPTRFDTMRELIAFAAIAVAGVPALSAFAGAALRNIQGFDYWQSWERWFLGDALAQLVITPAILYWFFDGWRRKHLSLPRAAEAMAVFTGLAVTAYITTRLNADSIYFTETAFYVPVPFLFWAALRFGMAGATGGVALLAFFVVDAALNGHGPFAGRTAPDISLALQNFLLLRSAPIYFIAVAIEQERSAERALRESEEQFRKLAESAPVLIWMSGPDKLCNYFNRGWLEFTGRTMAQEMGAGWAEGVHPDDLDHCLEQYHTAFDARQPFEIDYRLRRHDGDYRWIADIGVPRYGPDGDFVGYIGSAIDITDRKQVEEDHRALAHSQRLAVIGELTAALAHEIKQPLAAISLNAETLKLLLNAAKPEWEEIRTIASDILGNVQRTDSVMNLIRTFVRKPETKMGSIAPNEIVSDVLQLAGKDAARRGVRVCARLARGLPPVSGDRTQLQQLLLNLVLNAIDAMQNVPQPGRQLTLQTGRAPGSKIEIAVSDSGPGIPPEQMSRLFESFFTTKADGMGLGLSIARSIALAHGGEIRAEAGEEGGATFRVTLPIARGQQDSA